MRQARLRIANRRF
ncbi:arginine--tRNA ligase, partial [Escherichia coli 3006]